MEGRDWARTAISGRRHETVRVRDTLKPNIRQAEFYDACARTPAQGHVGFGGAIRSGKTQAAARVIVALAWRYGGTYLVGRRTYRRLEDSTKKAFTRGDGGLPPAVPEGLVHEYRAADNLVRLKNGGEILFRSVENPVDAIDMVKNITLSGWFIDQIEELDDDKYEELYDTLNGRMSDRRGRRFGISVANPGPETLWYYRRVVDSGTRDADTVYVHARLLDNKDNLDSKYLAKMQQTKDTRPDWHERYIMGEWGAFGGKRFKAFDRRLHVIPPFDIPSEWEIVEGIDYGWANPTVCVSVALDHYGLYFAVGEHAASEWRISDHATAIRQLRERHNLQPSASWLDPSAWAGRGQYASPAMEFHEAGLEVGPAQNDRLGGWNHIEELLSTFVPDPYWAGEGEQPNVPRLRIFDRCPLLIKELPNLKIKDGSDDVEKVNDHASDALRYVCNARPPKPIEKEPNRIEEMERRRLARLLTDTPASLYFG